jgi:hypothetical protein
LPEAAIINVVRHATLKTIDGGDEIMREEIKREYFKVGIWFEGQANSPSLP